MNPLSIISDPVHMSEIPHPLLTPFISRYEFHDHYSPGKDIVGNDQTAFNKKLCFQPETSIDFMIGDAFERNAANARKLILETRAILRTPIACKNCMPQLSGHFTVFSIKFHPTGLNRLLGFSMDSLGNNSIAVEETKLFPVDEMVGKMMYAPHISNCIRIVEPYLLPLAMNSRPAPGPTEQAAREIIRTNGLIPIRELALKSCLSVSQLEKNFNKKVGVSPKTYASMHRLFEVLRDKTKNQNDKWSALAYKHNYYDPIHFTREFKKYFSLNPTAFDFSRHLLL